MNPVIETYYHVIENKPTNKHMSEYDAEEEAYNARMRHWGMHDKKNEDVTIQDCISDLNSLMKIHQDRIKGVIVIPVYDHLEMHELCKQEGDKEENDITRVPSHCFLCSGGVPLMEAIGSIEQAKFKMLNSD